MEEFWYVAYGSNTNTTYFESRFDRAAVTRPIWTDEAWVLFPHELYFGGSSQTWRGSAVAFVSLDRSATPTLGRAYLINGSRFQEVLDAEHLSIPSQWDYPLRLLPVGGWCPLPTRAKYNAVLRLPDLDGGPAYTITTARSFEPERPSEDYVRVCRAGLAENSQIEDIDEYLETAIERSLRRPALSVPPRAAAPYVWRSTLARMPSTGYPTVRLARADSWINAEGSFPGEVAANGRRIPVWFLPPENDAPAAASPQVFRALGYHGLEPDELSCQLCAEYPVQLQRRPGLSDEIDLADRLHVSADTATRLNRWALLVARNLSAPVTLAGREHTPDGSVRVSYATRELLDIDGDKGTVSLFPIAGTPRPESRGAKARRHVTRAFRRGVEWAVGAPAIPLRATEAVVGDEGHDVVRVDATALDFLGVSAGDEVIVSWADRETTARALLQTDDLCSRMRVQLAGLTGRQSRLATRARDEHEVILWHLQAWLAPSIRYRLAIPPDTVVRIRRDVFHVLMRNLLALGLPVIGVVVAVLAIPDLPWPAQVVVPIAALLVGLLPLRLARV